MSYRDLYETDAPSIETNQSIFLVHLEQWISEKISENGLASKELVETIKSKFDMAIQANFEFHRFMAKELEGDSANHHELMSQVYKSLLK